MPNEGDIIRWRLSAYPKAHYEAMPEGQGGPHAMGGTDHVADTIQNIRTKCSDATIETTAGSAAAAASAVDAHETAYEHGDLPTNDEKQALGGTNGAPSGTNKYVTNSDPRNSDARTPTTHTHGGGDVTSAVANATDAANAASVEWTGVQNKPSTYPPSTHGHAESDVTNLVTDLAAKALDSDLSTHTGLTTTAHGGLVPSSALVGVAKITVGITQPVGPSTGDLRIDCN